MEIDNTERMDKIRIFTIACENSEENWIRIGMFVETSPTENAGKYSIFLHQDGEAIETMLFFILLHAITTGNLLH